MKLRRLYRRTCPRTGGTWVVVEHGPGHGADEYLEQLKPTKPTKPERAARRRDRRASTPDHLLPLPDELPTASIWGLTRQAA